MKDEEDDNIVPEGQEDDNTSAEEGFDDVFPLEANILR
jgi:topoisomerase-4 subunit A